MKKRAIMIMILMLFKTLFAVCHNRLDIKYLKLVKNRDGKRNKNRRYQFLAKKN